MNKEGKIELYRFLACVFIMIGHYVYYISPQLNIPFLVSFQFVDFFFIVTGFFTARHFSSKCDERKGVRYVLTYHLKKYLRFIPFTIPAILCIYGMESYNFLSMGDTAGFLSNLKDIILEVLFLSVFRSSGAHLFIMWYLSTMFITLPFLIAFFLLKNKWVKIIIGAVLPALYYIIAPDYWLQEPVNQLLRAFMGMMLGGTVYYLKSLLRDKDAPKPLKWVLTFVFAAAYTAPLVFAFNNRYVKQTYIICFFLWLFLEMSHLTVLGEWHSKILGFLGEISMPIFIWHIAVFKLIANFNLLEGSEAVRLTVSFAIVIIISVLNMMIVKLCKKYIKKT